ncbi:hypothetical protein LIT25_01695 [Bacillus sp. F19]|nr:hypothetical protein LIT25_01695 [Bacillus sp. F19]
MKGLLERAKEEQLPVEIIYRSDKGDILQRTIIVNEVKGNNIKAFCLLNNKPALHHCIVTMENRNKPPFYKNGGLNWIKYNHT